jgi:hypothetical protein
MFVDKDFRLQNSMRMTMADISGWTLRNEFTSWSVQPKP